MDAISKQSGLQRYEFVLLGPDNQEYVFTVDDPQIRIDQDGKYAVTGRIGYVYKLEED